MGNTSERPADDVERIVNEYGDMLYRLCALMLKNESDAEDVVQETIVKYYQKAPAFADQEHEKAWLTRVAANHYLLKSSTDRLRSTFSWTGWEAESTGWW